MLFYRWSLLPKVMQLLSDRIFKSRWICLQCPCAINYFTHFSHPQYMIGVLRATHWHLLFASCQAHRRNALPFEVKHALICFGQYNMRNDMCHFQWEACKKKCMISHFSPHYSNLRHSRWWWLFGLHPWKRTIWYSILSHSATCL